tara:strand:- start:394 stop:1053 length:660 start_codon:yes stop_codon:yes gene_type:complete
MVVKPEKIRKEQGLVMRFIFPVLGLLAVSACAPAVPDSGFGSYDTYQSDREIELIGESPALPSDDPNGTAGLEELTPGAGTTPLASVNNPGISDEQDFSAVSSRESIESDRERIEAQREQYVFIEPTAVPERAGSSGPNIVEFALSTTNRVGESIYRRGGLQRASAFDRNCAKYASPDLAQEAFLATGGPERDRHNLDPDGDGFACYWDPAPFRLVVNR